MDIHAILSQIQKNGYATLKIWVNQLRLQECIDAFRGFLASVPLAEREKMDFRYDPTQRFSVGFRDKSTSEWFDEKCYFHYNRILKQKNLWAHLQSYQDFIRVMGEVYDDLDILVHHIWDALIAAGYLERASFYADDGTTNNNLRILQYRPKETCKFLAKPHTDRWIFTLTVYETHAGLRLYHPDGTIEPVEYREFEVKMFPTDFWNKYVSFPLSATTHDVEKISWNTQRGSMVLFVNPAFWKWPYTEEDNIASDY